MRKLGSLSIKTKLTAYMMLMIVIISLAISFSSYNASKSAIQRQAGQLVSTSVEQVMKRSDMLLKNIYNVGVTLLFNENFTGPLFNGKFDYTKNSYQISRLVTETVQLNTIHTYIQSIYIYDLNHMIALSSTKGYQGAIRPDDEKYEIIERTFMLNKHYELPYIWQGGVKEKDPEDIDVIRLMLPIYSQTGELCGVLIINALEKSIESLYSDTGLVKSGEFYIEDAQGMIISAADKSLIGGKHPNAGFHSLNNNTASMREANGKESLETVFVSGYTHWKYVSVLPMESLMRENTANLTVILFLVVSVVAVFFLFLAPYRLHRFQEA